MIQMPQYSSSLSLAAMKPRYFLSYFGKQFISLCSWLFELRLLWYLIIGVWFSIVEHGTETLQHHIPDTQGSDLFSFLIRPFFEHRLARGLFGVSLIVALVVVGFFGSILPSQSTTVFADFPSGATEPATELSIVQAPTEIVVSTERRYQMPVDLIGVSQGFQRHHPGVDLRAAHESQIQPITEGVIVDVVHSAYGYGQAIIINHADGVSSMYAHVGKIFIDPGANVDKDTVIATVGLTGYTTGPHLHLEVYNKGAAVNPQAFLGY